jgi:hypothetical protein
LFVVVAVLLLLLWEEVVLDGPGREAYRLERNPAFKVRVSNALF